MTQTRLPSNGPQNKPHLQIKDLRTHLFTRWGVVKAVDGVTLDIREREAFGLVGESGSGKTMLAMSITGLIPKPAGRFVSGEILLDGEDLLKKSPREMRKVRGSKIGVVLQDPMTSLDPVFTIGKQIQESLQIDRKWGKADLGQRPKQLLQQVRIPEPEARLKSYPHQMSGGMRQRVLGAIALSREPSFLIADEPTTSLDVTTQAAYLRLLKDLQRDAGLTILLITHDFGVVARFCDRVGVMYAGKLVETGDVRKIFRDPQHPYTRALMESVPKADQDVVRLPSIEGQPPALHMLPPGCPFAPRCPLVDAKCEAEYPPTITNSDGHTVDCWRHVEQVGSSL